MKNLLIKLISFICVLTIITTCSINIIFADTNNKNSINSESDISPHASDYIISYYGTLSSKGSGSLSLAASISVFDAGTRITADIYKNGTFYDSVTKSSSNDDLTLDKTISVPSGSYYVVYKYQATLNGMAVETRTKTTSTVKVK